MKRLLLLLACAGAALSIPVDDAARIARASALVQGAKAELVRYAREIQDPHIRKQTLDALQPGTCIAHRAGLTPAKKGAILDELQKAGFVERSEAAMTGVFPPVADDGSPCPKLPQPFEAAPGSNFGGHHSYPGGLPIHERFNLLSALNFSRLYEQTLGPGLGLNHDLVLAPPIWHDWAKIMVFQWNADGTEFPELDIAKTGAHHILGLAESMKRGLPPEMILAQASAHAAPVLGNESKVRDWIRAAAIIAQVDAEARGYSKEPFRVEDSIHNLSDADFVVSIPAVTTADALLKQLAPEFGYAASGVATYNWQFRARALSQLTAERLLMIHTSRGLDGVRAELKKVRPSLQHRQ